MIQTRHGRPEALAQRDAAGGPAEAAEENRAEQQEEKAYERVVPHGCPCAAHYLPPPRVLAQARPRSTTPSRGLASWMPTARASLSRTLSSWPQTCERHRIVIPCCRMVLGIVAFNCTLL